MDAIHHRVRIGISACTFGCKVRWNGKGWNLSELFGRENEQFIWYPICPECNAGLGVPRTPIRLSGGSGAEIWAGTGKVISRDSVDVTEVLKEACEDGITMLKRAGVRVFVFMEGSPTCGVYRTTLKNKRLGKPPGVFGERLLKEGFFLIPALDLQSPIKRWDWRRRLLAFIWLHEQAVPDVNRLFEIWHQLKFLCQELDEPVARALGKELAEQKQFDPSQWASIRERIAEILRKPSTPEKIRNRLWKHYIHYRRKSGKTLDVQPPENLRSMTEVAKELILMEQASWKEEILFGASPVQFKKKPKPPEAF